jgi:S1-C subfamily serine protease
MRLVRSFWGFAAMLGILGSLVVCSARAQDAREIAKKAFPSVVMLLMEDSAGHPLSLGSGFFVKESVVATNLHVVAGAVKGYAKIVGQETKYHEDLLDKIAREKGYAKIVDQKTKYQILGYVGIDEQRDLVLLKIKDVNAPALSFGDNNKVEIGDEIFAVGNPQGMEGTFSNGIVSAIRTIGQDSLLQITAPISPGSSGGPVLNEKGEVIGVAVATFKGGQNLNFAIPASYLSPLLADTKPVRPLAVEKDAPKKAKSILSDLGGRNTEGVIGRQLMWDLPYLGDYSFTLQNNLQHSVQNVLCLVIFYDSDNQAIDVDTMKCSDIILPKLAKRVKSSVDNSVWSLTTLWGEKKPHTKVEFRILDFQLVEE